MSDPHSSPDRRRVGYLQFRPALAEVDANLEQIASLLAGHSADLIVLPELATTGYALPDRKSFLAVAEPIPGPSTDRLTELARATGGHLVAGIAERAKGKLYNSAVLVGGGGVVATNRKSHLFWNEKNLFDPGDSGFAVHDIGGLRVGIMICFDWAFPEAAGTLARRGAQLIAHPSNLVLAHFRRAMPVRCLENRVFAITANRFGEEAGTDGPVRFRGESMIISPRGDELAVAPAEADAVELVDIDPSAADDKYLTPTNHLFADRRPELYGED